MAVDYKISLGLKKWCEDKRFTAVVGVEKVAEEIGVSKEQLLAFFRLWMSKDFRLWRKELRIKEAMSLLSKDRSSSLTKIGEQVGIDDCSDFRKAFREVVGCYPKDWRAAHYPALSGRHGAFSDERAGSRAGTTALPSGSSGPRPSWLRDIPEDPNGLPVLPNPVELEIQGSLLSRDGNRLRWLLTCIHLAFTPLPNRARRRRSKGKRF